MTETRNPAKSTMVELAALVTDGELTVSGLSAVQTRLLSDLEGEVPLHVMTAQLTHIDAAALQLLWSLRRECEGRKRPLFIERPSDSVIENARLLGMQCVFDRSPSP